MEVMRKSIFRFVLPLFAVFPVLLISISTPGSVYAQNISTSSSTYTQPTYIPPNSPHSTSIAIYNFYHAVSCLLIGQSPISPCLDYGIYRDAQGAIKSVPILNQVNTNSGALGAIFSVMGGMYDNPPIHSSEYIAYAGKNIGVIEEASAQVGGSGSGVLSPIFRLWEVSRNVSYLVMILVFVFVGLMVMFRQKLNPQTVVSIQMALPGLVIGLVMITFSYFLASLISDMAFLGTNVVGYYFSLAQDDSAPTQLPLTARSGPKAGQEQNSLSIFSRYTNIIKSGDIKTVIDGMWDDLSDPSQGALRMDAQRALTLFAAMVAVQFFLPFGGLLGGIGQIITGTVVGGFTILEPTMVISWTLAFIAMVVLIYSMFRLLLRLLNSFLTIVFLTISAPFHFLAASLPGRQGIATAWFFNMLCNVLAFPAVFAVFYFVAFMLNKTDDPLFVINSTVPLAGNATFPLLGGLNISLINTLLAFGALIAAPSIPDVICKAVGKPGAAGGIVAGAISANIGAGQRYYDQSQRGISGFSNQVGRLTNEEGLVYNPSLRRWRPPENPDEASRVSRPGTIQKLRAGTESLFRRIR